VVANISTGSLPNYAAFSPDGKRVYVSNAGNNTVTSVDAIRWIVQWNAVVGASPEHIVLSKNGAKLFVNNVEDGSVSVVDVSKRIAVKTIPVGQTLHGIDLSDDGKTLFVAALGDNKLVAVNLVTYQSRQLVLSPSPYHLSVIRGSGKIYVSSSENPKIWVVNQKALKVNAEIPIGGKGHQIVVSSGG
jgi:YVTN family beta-propeller protein